MDKIKLFYYFYKEKDEIRNRNVTGVETCALRICEMVTEAFMTTKTQARETLSVSINSLGKLCKKRIATQPYLQGVERIVELGNVCRILSRNGFLDIIGCSLELFKVLLLRSEDQPVCCSSCNEHLHINHIVELLDVHT